MLIRARIGSKILTANVEKAFHTIYLQESQRDAVRFLWLKDVDKPPTPDNIKILRFCRLPFRINASPFLLGISIKHGIQQQKEISKKISEELGLNLYVDNVLMTNVASDSLINEYKTCRKIFNNMSMNLRQFMTNDTQCNNSMDPTDISKSMFPKISGVPGNSTHDALSVYCKLRYTKGSTKRRILQAVHSTFDPLGYLIPLLLPAKLFLQELWKRNYSWDDPLLPDDDNTWREICDNAADYVVATIPRSIAADSPNNRFELHTYVDPSNRSYAAAVYLRTICKNCNIETSLVMARQKLAPVKEKCNALTIPKLELLALLTGIRLTDFVLNEIRLAITQIRVYSDSMIALQ